MMPDSFSIYTSSLEKCPLNLKTAPSCCRASMPQHVQRQLANQRVCQHLNTVIAYLTLIKSQSHRTRKPPAGEDAGSAADAREPQHRMGQWTTSQLSYSVGKLIQPGFPNLPLGPLWVSGSCDICLRLIPRRVQEPLGRLYTSSSP